MTRADNGRCMDKPRSTKDSRGRRNFRKKRGSSENKASNTNFHDPSSIPGKKTTKSCPLTSTGRLWQPHHVLSLPPPPPPTHTKMKGQGLLVGRKPSAPILNFVYAFLIARCLYQPVLQRVQREDKGHQRRHSPAYKNFYKGRETHSPIYFLGP